MPTSPKRTRPRPVPLGDPERRSAYVDTSAWIALFSASDGNHEAAHAAFASCRREARTHLTSSLVLAEVHRLILFRANARAARGARDRILAAEDVRVEHSSPSLHASALGYLDRLSDQAVTYADAMSFAIMKAARCPMALTFDRHFWMAGFRVRPEGD